MRDHDDLGHQFPHRLLRETPGVWISRITVAPSTGVPSGISAAVRSGEFDGEGLPYFSQDGEILPDSQGLNFETVERAYLEAYEAALEMWGELLRQRRDLRRCAFRVRDGSGALMFTFPFAGGAGIVSPHAAPHARLHRHLSPGSERGHARPAGAGRT